MAFPFAALLNAGTKSNGNGGNGFSTLVNGATKPMRASMGLATGLVQSIQASKLKKKAEAAFPELVDPNQAGYLAELNQKRKSIETGADFAEGMQAIDTTNAATNDAITRNTGGDVGGTIQALLQSERASGDSKNAVLAQGQSQQINYDNAYGNMLDKISGRKLQLQLLRSQQARAEWDRKSKLASANLQAGMAGLVPGGNSKPQQGAQLTDGTGAAGGAAGTNFPSNWSFSGSQQSTPPANPNSPPATNVETTGGESPKATPAQPDGSMMKGLGSIMNLVKK